MPGISTTLSPGKRHKLQGKSYLCIPFLGIARPQSQPHIHVPVSNLYIPRISPHISLQQNRQTDPGNNECRNWETEHCNSVLEITFSFLEIHKWEPDIYIGFSPALNLQCRSDKDFRPLSNPVLNAYLTHARAVAQADLARVV